MEEAGQDGGGVQWQLVGVLISRSNQKMIVNEAKEIKAGFVELGCTVCSAKAQKVRERPGDSLGTHFSMFAGSH